MASMRTWERLIVSADRIEQANNRRSNRLIMLAGETKTLEKWIKAKGLKSSTVRQRLYVYKWSIEKSFGMEPRLG